MLPGIKKNIPTVFVVFGATGDLTARKIAPALFNLYQKNRLPEMFTVIGFARRELSDNDFRAHVRKAVAQKAGIEETNEQLQKFTELFSYENGLFEQLDDYKKVSQSVYAVDEQWGVCSNKLFYLAVPPRFYKEIFKNLHDSELTKPCSPEEGWTRVIVEKPFGKDLETAQELDGLLGKYFKEEQIYRIDHYLAKEMTQNILTFRFSNNLFEQAWDAQFIESIDIRLLEDIGVEERGAFYDGIGALRDVGQNHLLQMLALATMDHPGEFKAETIRAERAKILKQLKRPGKKDVADKTVRAQYEGYQNINGVAPDSQTETYFKLEAALDEKGWKDTAITMESGKRMGRRLKDIVITYRHPAPCLCPEGSHHKNRVRIALEPEERISVEFWIKKPGFEFETEKRTLEFTLRSPSDKAQYVEEYEKLLLDCIAGDQTLFVSTDEVQAMWRFIDPIIAGWRKGVTELKFYKPDSDAISHAADGGDASEKEKHGAVGIVGLGKMGGNIARRLLARGWRVAGYNKSEEATKQLERDGLEGAYSLRELVEKLPAPRCVWLMVPAGAPTGETVRELSTLLQEGDTVIDGGNSFYKDSVKRHEELAQRGIAFIDIGVSGGPSGALDGSSLMVGGEPEAFRKHERLFKALAVEGGYQFFEGAGAGHFVKMVHNGIEYGMMQALAEGFAIMKQSDYKLDLTRVADVYNHGSVIESRLVGWLNDAFRQYGEDLADISGSVGHTGEGAWTVDAARELGVPAKIIEGALQFRVESEKNPSYAGKVLSALRNQFGGHNAEK